MNAEFETFVDGLTPAQVRALASQAKIGMRGSVSGLRAELRKSDAAFIIWESIYGEVASG